MWLPGRGVRNEFQTLIDDESMQAMWVKPEDYWTEFPQGADLIILPGSAATVTDMEYLTATGFDKVVLNHVAADKKVFGVCGGYQLLGRKLYNPLRSQGVAVERDGLGLLPIYTLFGDDMIETTTTVSCKILPSRQQLLIGTEHRSGYSWRPARSLCDSWTFSRSTRYRNLNKVENRQVAEGTELPPINTNLMPGKIWAPGREPIDGFVRRDRLVWGSYLHGLFYNKSFVQALLA